MDEEPSLPPLPRGVNAENYSIPLRSYKRGHDSSNSSELPVFSSDDLPESSSENYTSSNKRKRHYRGTWWGANVAPKSTETDSVGDKRAFTRNLDSGIWMGSDGSDANDADASGCPTSEAISEPRVFCHGEHAAEGSAVSPSPRPMINYSERMAQSTIQDCLDNSKELVDLSDCGITELSNATLLPLRFLIRSPKFSEPPQSQESYQAFTPYLQIYLYQNALRTVPLELFSLHTIIALSLRNNKLIELPPAIGNLVNLKELNVACNQLRWLPWELLRLMRAGVLFRLTCSTNPFLQPFDALSNPTFDPGAFDPLALGETELLDSAKMSSSDPELVRTVCKVRVLRELAKLEPEADIPWFRRLIYKRGPSVYEAIYLCRSRVTFLEIDGSKEVHSPPPPSSKAPDELILPPAYLNQELDFPSPRSRAPSLLELSLRMCCDLPHVARVRDTVGNEVPSAVRRALQEAETKKIYGMDSCSVCGRRYLIPRTEWIEYWHCEDYRMAPSQEPVFIPFLRRGCSWRCVPGDPPDNLGLA